MKDDNKFSALEIGADVFTGETQTSTKKLVLELSPDFNFVFNPAPKSFVRAIEQNIFTTESGFNKKQVIETWTIDREQYAKELQYLLDDHVIKPIDLTQGWYGLWMDYYRLVYDKFTKTIELIMFVTDKKTGGKYTSKKSIKRKPKVRRG